MTRRICYLGHANSVHIQKWTAAFAELGWDVHLITYAEHDAARFHEGVTVHRLKNLKYSSRLLSFPRALYYSRTIGRTVKKIKPDILIKGEDWAEKGVVGREFVESCGGKVLLAPLVEGKSSTVTIEKMKSLETKS